MSYQTMFVLAFIQIQNPAATDFCDLTWDNPVRKCVDFWSSKCTDKQGDCRKVIRL